MNTEKLDSLDPDEVHLLIDRNYKRAQIGAIVTDTFIHGLKLGLPAKFAYKIATDGDLSKDEMKELAKI